MKKIILILLMVISSHFLLGVEGGKVLLKASSLGKYAKEGALVDMSYTTQHVQKNEPCEVKIVLQAKSKKGELLVWSNFDKNMNLVTSFPEKSKFLVDKSHQTHTLNVTLSSKEEGIFYLRLLVELEGKMRSFAIPLYVGDIEKKKVSSSLKKTKQGQNISVLPAIETIR